MFRAKNMFLFSLLEVIAIIYYLYNNSFIYFGHKKHNPECFSVFQILETKLKNKNHKFDQFWVLSFIKKKYFHEY